MNLSKIFRVRNEQMATCTIDNPCVMCGETQICSCGRGALRHQRVAPLGSYFMMPEVEEVKTQFMSNDDPAGFDKFMGSLAKIVANSGPILCANDVLGNFQPKVVKIEPLPDRAQNQLNGTNSARWFGRLKMMIKVKKPMYDHGPCVVCGDYWDSEIPTSTLCNDCCKHYGVPQDR